MDNFYELLVPTHKTAAYKLVNACFYVFAFLAVVSLSMLPVAIVCIALAVGAFFGKKKLYVEYEYVFTNGEIDVDRIVEMKKRKRIVSFDVKNIELLAPEDSYYVSDFSNRPSKVFSLFPKTTDKKVYSAIVTGGTDRFEAKLVLNEEFLNLCYKYNPRAVKKS